MPNTNAACHPERTVVAYGFCVECFKTWVSKRRPSELHGLTIDQACEMMALQEGACYLCGYAFLLRMPILEHNHFTKRARGWSCQPCNQSIAAANGSPHLLRDMATRLEHPPGDAFFEVDPHE